MAEKMQGAEISSNPVEKLTQINPRKKIKLTVSLNLAKLTSKLTPVSLLQ